MVDFTQLLRKPAGESKRPKALPIGDYPGVVRSWEVGDQNKNRTPYVRFQLVLTEWPDSVSDEDREASEVSDLSKRALRKDFYLTEESTWRLDNFIRSCDVDPMNRTYEEVLPQLIGQPVIIHVDHYLNQQSGDIGNSVGEVVGVNGRG